MDAWVMRFYQIMAMLLVVTWTVELWIVRHEVAQGLYGRLLPIGPIRLTENVDYWLAPEWVGPVGIECASSARVVAKQLPYGIGTFPWPGERALMDADDGDGETDE